MRARSGRRSGRGFTLVELLIAITIASVVLGATYKLLTSNQRFYRGQSELMDVQQNLRAAGQIVPGDLRELDAKGGDLVAMADTAVTIRAMRGFGVVCKVDAGNNRIFLRSSLLFMSGSIDVTRHSVFVFREADSTKNRDDTWQQASITDVSASTCADGTTASRLTLSMTNAGKLDSVTVGGPVRIWEQVKYLLYDDGTGARWLGTATWQSGAWTTTRAARSPRRRPVSRPSA